MTFRTVFCNVFCLLIPCCIVQGALPVMTAPKVAQAPVIDGKADDSAWKQAEWSESFVKLTGRKSEGITRCKFAFDDHYLYLLISCDVSDPAALKSKYHRDSRDGELWTEDSVEIFLGNDDPFNYYQLIVNSNGARYDGMGMSPGWNGDWVVSTKIKDGIWITEIAVPWKTLNINPPKTGEIFRINVAREDQVRGEITAWSATRADSLHIAERFGVLVMDKPTQRSEETITKIQEDSKNTTSTASAPAETKIEVKAEQGRIRKAGKPFKELTAQQQEAMIAQGLVLWTDSPLNDPDRFTLPAELPDQPKIIKKIHVYAAMDEHRSAVLNLFNPLERSIRVRVFLLPQGEKEEQRTPGAIRNSVHLSRVMFIAGLAAGSKDRVKYYADAIEPLGPSGILELPAREARQIWIDVDTHNVSAGTYKADLAVQMLDQDIERFRFSRFRIPLELTVWPFRLPEKMPIHVQLWDHAETIVPYDVWGKDMQAHYVTGSFHVWNNVFNLITSPDRIGEELVDAYEKRTGLKLRESLSAKHEYGKIMFGYGWLKEFEQRLAGRLNLKFMSPEWKAAFKESVLTMRSYLDSIGISPQDYIIQLWDEADGGAARRVAAAGQYFKQIAPDIRTMMDVTSGTSFSEAFVMDPVTDIWCPSFYRMKAMPEEMIQYRKTGKKVWMYQCPTDAVSQSPLETYRKYPWWGWKRKVDGLAYWNYNSSKTDPWNNFDHGGYQDCMLIYPTPTGPIPSRRWEAWREGMEDYLYLYVLEQFIEKAKAAGVQESILLKNQTLIDEKVERVTSSSDSTIVEQGRFAVAQGIMQLQEILKEPAGEMNSEAN